MTTHSFQVLLTLVEPEKNAKDQRWKVTIGTPEKPRVVFRGSEAECRRRIATFLKQSPKKWA